MARLRVTQVRSTIDCIEQQKRTMRALGIRRMHQTVEHDDTAAIRGMIEKVYHLVQVEEVGGAITGRSHKTHLTVRETGRAKRTKAQKTSRKTTKKRG
jgi:large subunit ribosomal protein L30